LQLSGRVLVAAEGINGALAGARSNIEAYLTSLVEHEVRVRVRSCHSSELQAADAARRAIIAAAFTHIHEPH